MSPSQLKYKLLFRPRDFTLFDSSRYFYPHPSSRPTPALLATQTDIYVFGGTDAAGALLGDFWIGRLALNAQLTDITGLTWTVAPVNSGAAFFTLIGMR
jgi:hypothetical protein